MHLKYDLYVHKVFWILFKFAFSAVETDTRSEYVRFWLTNKLAHKDRITSLRKISNMHLWCWMKESWHLLLWQWLDKHESYTALKFRPFENDPPDLQKPNMKICD